MTEKELTKKIRDLRKLQAKIEAAEREAEAIRNDIKAVMGDSEELRAGEYKVTWKYVTTCRLDTTALKKALPEVADRFSKETTTRRFCVA